MAKIVKTIFEVAEEVAYKKAYEIAYKEGIDKANQKIHNAIRALVQTSSWNDEQIADVMEVDKDLVKIIRQELENESEGEDDCELMEAIN
jgi:hypothetical protein